MTTAPARNPPGSCAGPRQIKGRTTSSSGSDLEWTYSPLLYSYERGNMDNELYEITEDEANRIVERIRRSVSGEE